MIEEAYVSFEVAKLLKEKGFDWACIGYYVDDEPDDVKYSFLCETNSIWESRCCSAPTLQMAMAWLRREFGLHCSVDYDYVLGWYCQITSLKETVEYDHEEMKHYHPDKDNGFSSPEEACEAAIKYCLDLI